MLKKVVSTKGYHVNNHYGHELTLECGHTVFRMGSEIPKRARCQWCEDEQSKAKAAKEAVSDE